MKKIILNDRFPELQEIYTESLLPIPQQRGKPLYLCVIGRTHIQNFKWFLHTSTNWGNFLNTQVIKK